MIRPPTLRDSWLRCIWPCLLLLGCTATPSSSLDDADYPGMLQRPTALPVEAVWQQHVTATWQQGPDGERQERGFDAAVQRQGETLTVLGLSPMGSVGFAIVQSEDGIEVQTNMPETLPIPARFILLDVQRTFFSYLGDATMGTSDGPADRVARIAGEEIDETWLDGRLQRRTFVRLDGEPPGEITITYTWGQPDWAVPTRAVLDNGWFGYRLTIDTHSETRLGRPAAEAGR